MLDNQLLILAEVVAKLFVDVNDHLPENDIDSETMKTAILKIYKSGLQAQELINKLKK